MLPVIFSVLFSLATTSSMQMSATNDPVIICRIFLDEQGQTYEVCQEDDGLTPLPTPEPLSKPTPILQTP